MAKTTRPGSATRNTQMRRGKRLLRFGVDDPSCAVCGYNKLPSLQIHEPAGQANQQVSMVLCRNHHDELSDRGIDSLCDLRKRDPARDPLTVLAALFRGLIDFLELLCETLEGWSNWLIAAGAHLTESMGPQWWDNIPVAVPL
jgi:hypothetical protein